MRCLLSKERGKKCSRQKGQHEQRPWGGKESGLFKELREGQFAWSIVMTGNEVQESGRGSGQIAKGQCEDWFPPKGKPRKGFELVDSCHHSAER